MSFIFFLETSDSGYVDVMLLRRQEEPTERTFDELLDHLEASLMQAGPTVWRIFLGQMTMGKTSPQVVGRYRETLEGLHFRPLVVGGMGKQGGDDLNF